MASSRVINTGFWKDRYVVDLATDERLLFLYLLTNPQTNIAGIYELSIREMEFDTSISHDRILEILQKFIKDKKIYYQDGWLALMNWMRHQSSNPKVATGILRIIENLPVWLRNDLLYDDENDSQTPLPIDTLSIDHDRQKTVDKWQIKAIYSLSKPIALNLTKLNLTKPNANAAEDGKKFEDGKSMSPTEKRNYAIAMKHEREQDQRKAAAAGRPQSKPVRERNWR